MSTPVVSPSPDSAPDSSANQVIAGYFDQLLAAFGQAADNVVQQNQAQRLAGRTIRLGLAGKALEPVLRPALAHLTAAESGALPDLEILAWDTHSSGVMLPPPPWIWPEDNAPHRVSLPATADQFRLIVAPDRKSLLLYHRERHQAMLWVENTALLAAHWYGSPLLKLFHWWGISQGLHLLHAGCVGTDAGAVLFAGRGGSGKSTTSLLCLEAGLRYVSDDYCLLEPGPSPVAHCLYNSGKLHGDHFRRFPDLGARTINPRPQDRDKPILFTHPHFASVVTGQLPLRAVLLPRITGKPETTVVRISAVEALRGLAPSTLMQLPSGESQSLAIMAGLVRGLPCYRLELGTRLEAIAPVVSRLIAEICPLSSPAGTDPNSRA